MIEPPAHNARTASSGRTTPEPGAMRGSNQSGVRAHNERLVLSMVRSAGALAKSDIARMTGLSAQTVSVIMRALEADGLLRRGEPVRGRIGQPSVPLSLAADGAYFFGLKIGRRSVDLVLVDFLGQTIGFRRRTYRYPTPDAVIAFVEACLPKLTSQLPPDRRRRIAGLGIAMPFQLWSWVDVIGAPQAEMDAWRTRDIEGEIAALADLPVYVQNDATAACGAELVFGAGGRFSEYLYFYFGYFIGDGLVLDGRLFTGRSGNAAGVGPMPVPGPDGTMRRLLEVASLSALAADLKAAGARPDAIWEVPEQWPFDAPVIDNWIDTAAAGLANATLGAASLFEPEAVIIDGWMPADIRARITNRTAEAFHRFDLSGIDAPAFEPGTVGPQARALGAAAVSLSKRYLVE